MMYLIRKNFSLKFKKYFKIFLFYEITMLILFFFCYFQMYDIKDINSIVLGLEFRTESVLSMSSFILTGLVYVYFSLVTFFDDIIDESSIVLFRLRKEKWVISKIVSTFLVIILFLTTHYLIIFLANYFMMDNILNLVYYFKQLLLFMMIVLTFVHLYSSIKSSSLISILICFILGIIGISFSYNVCSNNFNSLGWLLLLVTNSIFLIQLYNKKCIILLESLDNGG
ncbi:MAG: hypothetical protein E7168_04395 [Firmicutes bacterium]|nr:hypothetical protein [Bacillota bacterium]